ncbi:MAG: hypothetical protein IJH85_05485, partial [Clostridia bacterium]|nr:hypothetical protein [Clostridia bacterium]
MKKLIALMLTMALCLGLVVSATADEPLKIVVMVFFNVLGLLGMAIFIASIAIVLLGTKPFEILKAEKEPEPIEV